MKQKTYYAHQAEDGRMQTVLEHLEGTARRCAAFAGAFQAEEQGRLAGLSHDIGKYTEGFQRRLLQNGPKVDHATAGAFECQKLGQPFAAFCVAGHHSGLLDLGGRGDRDKATFCARMNKAGRKELDDYSAWKQQVTLPQASKPEEWAGNCLDADFFTRMLYSCLTDADFLDTEAFMTGEEPERGDTVAMSELAARLDAYTSQWFPPRTELNAQRCAILEHCMEQGRNGERKPGLYTLTVPTGGGKTVASLAFALNHAKTHDLSRVIYVIPYTSIIEQTADIFREILGPEHVLEHHSGVLFDTEEESTPESQRLARATENWDMPVVVTTAVQFFESIYSNRSSKCRKLHNLAQSVIIFDEAQMLPEPYLRPCVSAISQLAARYGATAVLCTATQPALDRQFQEFLPGQPAVELCPQGICDWTLFRRVTFRRAGRLPWDTVAEKMRELPQVLCIVNTRKSAGDLFERLAGEEGVYHLSTLMTPAHRRTVLKAIQKRLTEKLPCRVVATSLIEAGVDVDFPAVFREENGLDSILQAAGRCNREGKRTAEESVVTVFRSETPVPPLFQTAATAGQVILDQYADPLAPEAVTAYFRELLDLKGTGALDKNRILEQLRSGTFPFATVAGLFRLIDSNTRTVYIPVGEGAQLVQRLRDGERSRRLFRELGQYSVSIYEQHFQALWDAGDILPVSLEHGEELWVLANTMLYSEQMGLSIQADTGKGLFV